MVQRCLALLVLFCAGLVLARPQQQQSQELSGGQQEQQQQPQQQQQQSQQLADGQQEQQQSQQLTTVRPIGFINQSSKFEADGSYKFSYETENGIHVEEESIIVPNQASSIDVRSDFKDDTADGSAESSSPSGPVFSRRGAYSYTAPDGTPISLSWVADKNGFQVMVNNVPTSAPIEQAVARLYQGPQGPQEHVWQ